MSLYSLAIGLYHHRAEVDVCLGHPPAVLGQHPQVVSEQEVGQLRIPLGLVVANRCLANIASTGQSALQVSCDGFSCVESCI